MKLIYIYGPPAVGKLTVAKELSKLTSIKVFHNHLTVDLLKPFFIFGSERFLTLSTSIRHKIFEAAAQENIEGLIYTCCYSFPEDNEGVQETISVLKKYDGEIFFVRLYADTRELKKRVLEDSRKNFGKVKSIDDLEKSINKWNMFTSIPFVKSLEIDNTNTPPYDVALRIKDYCSL